MSLGRLVPVFATLTLLGASFAGCEVSVDTGGEGTVEPIALEELDRCDRPNLPDRLLCGSVSLPLETEDPDLGEIEIAFAVLPANQPQGEPRKGLLGIEGGPGYGSIGSAGLYQQLLGDVLDDRDLIAIDARGTGLSEAIACPDLQRGTTTRDIGVAACAEQLGDRYESFRTSAIADDFASVLDALGY